MSRRRALALLSATLLAGCSKSPTASAGSSSGKKPACILTPEQTEGPYFVDERLHRSDIRIDPADGVVKEGAPLLLALTVTAVQEAACMPIAGAQVDIWHCDADGVYSDATDQGFSTTGQKFLRGYQMTDADGRVQFVTIYPGWYRGRTVHIHFKVRATTAPGQTYEFTSQLYFDDAVTDRVFEHTAYAARGPRSTRNDRDGIFRRNGQQLMLAVTETGQGYAASFDVGLDIHWSPSADYSVT